MLKSLHQIKGNERKKWERLLHDAGVDLSKLKSHSENKAPAPSVPHEQDHLYKLIDPERQDDNDENLFGMAKTFPKVTRSGYRKYIHDHLRKKADKYDENGVPKSDRHVTRQLLTMDDFRIFYRLKQKYHAEFAEFFGMFVFLMIGFSSSVQELVSGGVKGDYTTVVLSWGIGNMVGIYIAGGYSGAHLNPTLTLNLWFFRGFPLRRVFGFWIAQFFGALAASAWIFILYYPALRKVDPKAWGIDTGSTFFTVPASDIPIASAWFNEVTASAVMHAAIFAVGDSGNVVPVRGMNAFILALTLTAIGSCFGYLSPFGMNPFRDLAPRIFLTMVGYPRFIWYRGHLWWLVGLITGPTLGGFLGCFAYDSLVFDGVESPINFPIGMTRRTIKLWFHMLWGDVSRLFRKKPHRHGNGKLDSEASVEAPNYNGGYADSQLHGRIQVTGQPAG